MLILNKIKSRIVKILFNKNIINKSTDKKKLELFFEKIKPIKTNYDLIRVGGDSDGGYLIPDDIDDVEFCFSPGVSDLADFENDLTKRGIKCFLADYSVDRPPILNNLFDFEKKYIGLKNDEIFITLEDWIESKAPGKTNLILQMDIEGGEYPVIFDTSNDSLKKFKILVIEFHNLDGIFNKFGFELINLTFEKILKNFAIVHIHPNNCCNPISLHGFNVPPVMEFTFLRKDRIAHRAKVSKFPHDLDRANVPQNKDFPLPDCWY